MMLGSVRTIDGLEQNLLVSEREKSRLCARQVEALRQLDVAQVDLVDGCRSMVEWVASRLDVTHRQARDLVFLSKAADRHVEEQLASGEIGLDRAVAMVRLHQAGASSDVIAQSHGYDLGGIARLTAGFKRLTAAEETERFEERYLMLQSSLDESALKYWGQAIGEECQAIEKALTQRAEEFPSVPGVDRRQKMADAFTSICLDSLTSGSEGRAVTVAEVFVDATLAAPTDGEAGVTLSTGTRVGPNTLCEILCTGKVRVIVTGGDGRPIGASDLGGAIPPAVRAVVWKRDQGACTIDGCQSRYRLQPHHIIERHDGGDHDSNNITLLCWYHHHVAVHMLGLKLDPDRPPQRRRLIGWRPTTGPPDQDRGTKRFLGNKVVLVERPEDSSIEAPVS